MVSTCDPIKIADTGKPISHQHQSLSTYKVGNMKNNVRNVREGCGRRAAGSGLERQAAGGGPGAAGRGPGAAGGGRMTYVTAELSELVIDAFLSLHSAQCNGEW
ncbi:unnamed protein product [Colias eurytheme]|nr:unnamed protein product [Colias eurytheme]